MPVITVVKMLCPQQILTTVMMRIVVDGSADHTKPPSICFLPQYQRKEINLCLGNWKHRVGFKSARAALCKWAACTRQTFLSKSFANSPNMQKQLEKKMFGKRVMTRSRCRQEYRPRKPHFNLFLTTISTSKKMFFFSECELEKALHDTLTRAAWYGLLFTTAN